MPLCTNCGEGMACSGGSCSSAPEVGATAAPCPLQQGSIWVLVTTDAGVPVRAVTAIKGTDELPTDASGLAKFDPLDTGVFDVHLKALGDDLLALYEPAPTDTQRVPVANGTISHVTYELKRKAALKVRISKAGNDSVVFANATVSVTGPQTVADATTNSLGVADLGLVKAGRYSIKVVLASTHTPEYETTDDFTAGAHDVDVSVGDALTVQLTTKPIVYDLANVACAARIAPGNDSAFRFTFDVTNSNGKAVTSGTWEVQRKSDLKVIKTAVALEADQLTAGSKSLPWDGAVNTGDTDFPDDFATLEHSPYLIVVKIVGAKGAKTGTAEVKVELAKFTVDKAPKTTLTSDKDKAVWDQLPTIPATSLVELKLRSNIFMVASSDMTDSTAYTEYDTYWGAGPRIPLVAGVTIYDSANAEVKAGKALGRARVLWDYTEPVQSRSTYLAPTYSPPPWTNYSHGAKPFVDRAINYDQVEGRPKGGDNCHVTRGGKRGNVAGADPVMAAVDSDVTGFPYTVVAGTTRWWAALGAFKKSGAEESQAGVVFRPSRMAGDSYAVTAYLDLKAALDVADVAPTGAAATVAVGTFEVWREITIAKHVKKNAAVTGAMPSIAAYFGDAYVRVTDTSGGVTMMAKAAYDTAFATAQALVVRPPVLLATHALNGAVSQFGDPIPNKWVGVFRSFADFKAQVAAASAPPLNAGQLATVLATNGVADAAAYGSKTAYYAHSIVEKMCKTVATDEGITVFQFATTTEPEDFVGPSLNGAAVGVTRHVTAFALYQTNAAAEQTPAHEIGHNMMLPHSPRISAKQVESSAGGITPNRHDRRNRNCLMSYARPREGLCGLCLLRLRGWKENQFTELGPIDPALTTIAPVGGAAGAVVNVTLTGTGFLATSTVAVTGTGITVSDVVIASTTSITAKFTIAADAAGSPYFVTVKTPKGETPNVEFAVAPVFTSLGVAKRAAHPHSFVTTLRGKNLFIGATAAVSGAGVTVASLSQIAPAECLIEFTVAPGALPGERNVTVTTPGGTSGVGKLTIVAVPTLTSVTPALGVAGTAVDVTLTGTGFIAGSSVVGDPSGRFVVSNVVVASATSITARLTIPPNAVVGICKLSVVVAGGSSAKRDFTVLPPAPTLTSLSVTTSEVGKTLTTVLTGTNFTGATAVAVSGAGATATFVVDSATQITATVQIAADAAAGARNVTVTTPSGTTAAAVLTLTLPAAPTLTTIAPDTGVAGTAFDVVFTGTNFSAVTALHLGADVTLTAFALNSATQITATIEIAATAAAGPRAFDVVTAGGTTAAVDFDVTLPPAPTVTTVTPDRTTVYVNQDFVIEGTGLLTTQSVGSSDASVIVKTVTPDSDTQLTINVDVMDAAALGTCTFTVTTVGGVVDADIEVEASPALTISSISPDNGDAGTDVSAIISGNNIVGGPTAAIDGAGVTLDPANMLASDELGITLHIDAAAAAGPRTITVTTASGSATIVFDVN